MGCIIEFGEPPVRFDFCQNKNKQKIWLDVLLKYSSLNLQRLAKIMDVPAQMLKDLQDNKCFLNDGPATNLAELFLIYFSD